MKKIILLVTLLASLTASAQFGIPGTGHLQFMGVPIKGNYQEFSQRLEPMGIKYDHYLTWLLHKPNEYVLQGKYMGEKANFFLNYDPQTQIVYSISAAVPAKTEAQADEIFENTVYSIESNYGALAVKDDGATDSNVTYTIYDSADQLLGKITVSELQASGTFNVVSTYVDALGAMTAGS